MTKKEEVRKRREENFTSKCLRPGGSKQEKIELKRLKIKTDQQDVRSSKEVKTEGIMIEIVVGTDKVKSK